ncbi:MAG: ABC transporter permease [Caldilineaceae bacterium]|nr:ABC transporter permease [Caldilineaceae bacterium]
MSALLSQLKGPRFSLRRIGMRHPYLFTLLLMIIALVVNYSFQPNLFELRVLNGNLRIFLPLMILAAGQAIVVMGGGIDLSVGAMVSLGNAVLVTMIANNAATGEIALGIAAGLGIGLLAGAFNGICVAYLRLQPIVTTYATSFIFAGAALYILERPGGSLPSALTRFYRTPILEIPLGIWAAAILILLWVALRGTRYGRYLFAVGGQPDAAYATGVNVAFIRFSTYVIAGLMAGIAALAVSLNTGTGDPRIGDGMTLASIVAVVLGGTRLSGGQGGVAGAIMGVVILGVIRNIISFANVPTWWQTLVDALIILLALAGPGIVNLIRRSLNRR